MALSGLLTLGASPLGSLDVSVENLRSSAGVIQVCLTRDPDHFPDCDHDPAARHMTVPAAADPRDLNFEALPSGDYAVALFHDENSNGKLDTRLGIPTEGVGFSRNPRLLFGPPHFHAASIAVFGAEENAEVKVRYFL